MDRIFGLDPSQNRSSWHCRASQHQHPVSVEFPHFISHAKCEWEVGWCSSALRMVDDSEGKAIGSDDCYLMPVQESPVSRPIHRLQFFDPVLRGLPRFLQAISPEHGLVKSC